MKYYCINLESRPERWERARAEFNKHNLIVERFNGIRKNPGYIGCRDSHLAILSDMKKNRWHDDYKFVTIFEDDIEFLPDWRENMSNARRNIPIGWDILYLGCSPQEPLKKIGDYIYRAKNCLTTHAMLFNNKKHGVVDAILSMANNINKIDVFYKDVIQERFMCYAMYPMGVTQYQSQSDTCTRCDTSTILSNFLKYTQ